MVLTQSPNLVTGIVFLPLHCSHQQMMRVLVICVLVLPGWGFVMDSSGPCPVPTPCLCDSLIRCDHHAITIIPTIVNSSQHFTVFDLSHNRIDYISPRAFEGLDVDTIDLSGNPLVLNMDDDALLGLENVLEQLILHHTSLSSLPKSLGKMRKLTRLNVADSHLQVIDNSLFDIPGYPLQYVDLHNARLTQWPTALGHLSYLRSLDLSHNRIYSIPNNSVVSFARSLTSLDISGCELRSFPNELSHLKYLRELHIGDNNIGHIPAAMFYYTFRVTLQVLNLTKTGLTDIPSGLKYARAITTLYLSHNPIADPHASGVFTGLGRKLTHLFLDHCQLRRVPPAIERLTNLHYLNMSYNDINVLENYAFSSLKSLDTLSLDGNDLHNIKHAALNGMDSLRKLYLHNCSLPFFPGSALMGNPIIELVDLSYNLITELHDASVPYLKHLTSLSLSGNEIVNMSVVSFSGLPSLDLLYLNDCGLDDVPKAVEYATSARYVQLHRNDITCDCGLKWLWEWKKAHGLIPHIEGECLGNTSIDLDTYIRQKLMACP